MDDWNDLAPGALSYTEPAAPSAFQPPMFGPLPAGDPTAPPNQVAGDMTLPRGASILLSGGAMKNNGRGSDFEISEDMGLLARGVGINLAAQISCGYESAPVQWFSEVSFVEVSVTAAYPTSPKDHFYSDAFKQNITGNLTVSSVVDNGDSWVITFTGATLTADMQVGNVIEPDWVVIWWKYLEIVSNGADWVEVLKSGAAAPVATNTFSIHGVYANTIMTWQQPRSLWFVSGGNVGAEALLSVAVGHTVDRTTGLVELSAALPNNIAVGDRLKAYDERVILDYGWSEKVVSLAPSDRCPDGLRMWLGYPSGPGVPFQDITLFASDGILLFPCNNVHDKTVTVRSFSPGYRAHLEVRKGNLTLTDGYMAIKEGISEPVAVTGQALIYIDSADSQWKIKFSDGSVKKIAFVGPE